MNIYVGNLSYEVMVEDLQKAFEEFGKVESVKIITDTYTGRSKGFGFVEMPNEPEARSAISSLKDKELKGRKIDVGQARPQRSEGRRNGENRGGGGRRRSGGRRPY